MVEWLISVRGDASKRHGYQDFIDAISAAFGPVTARAGELSGNPRDLYWRDHTIEADHTLVVSLSENSAGDGDPDAMFDLRSATILADATFADRMAAWTKLTAVLAKLDYVDTTYQSGIADIVDDARAEGDTVLADRLARETTAKLVADAPAWTQISMVRTPADRAAVIAACTPERVTMATIEADDLPGLRAFANLTFLEIPRLDPVRGCTWFPKLERLSGGVDHLERAHVASFPGLKRLFLRAVQTIDHDVLDVIPGLEAITIYDTQLAANTAAREALQAAWPDVRVWYDIAQGYIG